MASILYARNSVEGLASFLLANPPPALSYPTMFTQGIVPKGIHSHNDYWRAVPLLTGLAGGVTSTEADVWLLNGTLYVGHVQSELSLSRTLASLYLDPLMEILALQNPTTSFTDSTGQWNGVYNMNPSQSIQLMLDLKSNGTDLHPVILEALEPLRSKGYLTTFYASTNTTKLGPITVTASGNAINAIPLIVAQEPRDLFLDAPLANLTMFPYGSEVSPMASTDFGAAVGWSGFFPWSSEESWIVKNQIDEAHRRGMKVRYWNTPAWPVFARNRIWESLLKAGVDYLNADDVEGAAKY